MHSPPCMRSTAAWLVCQAMIGHELAAMHAAHTADEADLHALGRARGQRLPGTNWAAGVNNPVDAYHYQGSRLGAKIGRHAASVQLGRTGGV
eukprot:310020-Chlamydomonas_euryale.AAC.1